MGRSGMVCKSQRNLVVTGTKTVSSFLPSLKRPKPFFPSFRAFTRSLCFWLLSPHFLLRQLATEGGRGKEKRSLGGETVTKNAKQRSASQEIYISVRTIAAPLNSDNYRKAVKGSRETLRCHSDMHIIASCTMPSQYFHPVGQPLHTTHRPSAIRGMCMD